MELVDTHAHLDFTDDASGWLERAKTAGVGKIICVGTSVAASRKCVEIAEKYSSNSKRHSRESGNLDSRFRIKSGMTKGGDLQIYATIGIHPQDGQSDIKNFGSLAKCIDELKLIAGSSNKVVGVGECGLDIRRTVDPSTDSASSLQASSGQAIPVTTDNDKEFQGELFGAQVRLAVDLGLPLIVHCRNAFDETFDLLSAVSGQMSDVRCPGLFHSWTGDFVAAKKALDLGFYISFSGIVTFKNAPNVQEVAKKIPLSRMLVETDSPFLSPHPYRGMKNEPKNVRITAQFIADLRGEGFDKIAEATSRNAGRLFGI